MTQRDVMKRLYLLHNGNKEAVIEAYAVAEEAGEAPRRRNSDGVSSRKYARLLFYNGVGTGWLPKEWREANPSRIVNEAQARTVSSREPKSVVDQTIALFESSLREMAQFWRDSDARPRADIETLKHWRELIAEWVEDASMPLLVRKGTLRGIRYTHPSGRICVGCDNSPAHWAMMGALASQTPSLEDVRLQISNGQLPMKMVHSRAEKAHIEVGLGESIGGFLGSSAYGQVNRFPDGRSFKLCHIESCGIRSRGEIVDLPIESLKSHMRRFMDPDNMILVPLKYSGIGECETFLNEFHRRAHTLIAEDQSVDRRCD